MQWKMESNNASATEFQAPAVLTSRGPYQAGAVAVRQDGKVAAQPLHSQTPVIWR